MTNTYLDSRGYYRFKGSKKLIHRSVAEALILKRPLKKGEVVHHKNGNRQDNRPENLQVMSKTDHDRHHRRFRKSKRYRKECLNP